MNIHFIASTKGGRQLQAAYSEIVSLLETHGYVHGKQLSDPSLTSHGESALSSEAILDRELTELEQADVIVAEVTTPSLGVGYMIGKAEEKSKTIIALYQGDHLDKLSAMIRGNDNLSVHLYKTKEDLGEIFSKELK